MKLTKKKIPLQSVFVFLAASMLFACSSSTDMANKTILESVSKPKELTHIELIYRETADQILVSKLTQAYLKQVWASQGLSGDYQLSLSAEKDLLAAREKLKNHNAKMDSSKKHILAWEYTGAVIANEYSLADFKQGDQSALEYLNQLDAQYNLKWLASLDVKNQFAFALRRDKSIFFDLVKLSDLQNPDVYRSKSQHAKQDHLRLGLERGFYKNRKDGYSQLVKTYQYNVSDFKIEYELLHADVFSGLRDDAIDVGLVYSQDPQLDLYNLRLLEDDKEFFPNYWLSLMGSQSVLGDEKLMQALLVLSRSFNERHIHYGLQRWVIDKLSIEDVVDELVLCAGYYQEPSFIRDKDDRKQYSQSLPEHCYLEP